MRLEHLPILVGLALGLLGVILVADAWLPDDMLVPRERRRRQRAERHRVGEAVVGLGTLAMAASFIGRDTWRYGTLAVLFGTALLLVGIALNRRYLSELLFFRGAARRAPDGIGDRPSEPDHARDDRSAQDSGAAPPAPGERKPGPSETTPTSVKRFRIR